MSIAVPIYNRSITRARESQTEPGIFDIKTGSDK
jgi:hypothetical protein